MLEIWKRIKTGILCVLLTCSSAGFSEDVRSYRALGKADFDVGKYQTAASYFKKYLTVYEKDFDAWTLLGASYYHMGLADRGLHHLSNSIKYAYYKSLNYYYQGLCYLALEDTIMAKKRLAKAAKAGDLYATYSIVELAILEYQERDYKASLFWINEYQRLAPTGFFAAEMQEMRASIDSGQRLTDLKRTSPDIQRALYHYNKLSLVDYPHFWFFQTGYLYEIGTQETPEADPTGASALRNEDFSLQFLNLSAGFGIGPIAENGAVSYVGYNYIQHWITTSDRMDDYLGDPFNFQYIPYQPDLLERHHQLYFDVRKSIASLGFGLDAKYELVKIGSSLLSSADAYGLSTVTDVSTITTIIPWIQYYYSSYYSTKAYLFMRKEIDNEDDMFSNETYNSPFGRSPLISIGAIQRASVPRIRTEFNVQLFHYETIYNDYWLDNTRNGILLGSDTQILPHLKASSLLGYYDDDYNIQQIRSDSCVFQNGVSYSSTPNSIKKCVREDTGLMLQLGLQWNFSRFQALSGYYRFDQSSNQFKINNVSSQQIFFNFTITFPDFETVEPFIDRIENQGFYKQVR